MAQAIQAAELRKQFVERETGSKAHAVKCPSIKTLASFGLIILAIFSLCGRINSETSRQITEVLAQNFTGFYAVTMNIYVLACIGLFLSPAGKIRLGANATDRPQFSTMSWLTMLFSGGMGIGLFFYGVAEPLSHHAFTYQGREEAVKSLSLTIMHWGIHPWSCYAMVGLCYAFFAYCKNKPFSIRSCFSCAPERHSILGNFMEAA